MTLCVLSAATMKWMSTVALERPEGLLVKEKYDSYFISNHRGVEWAALDLLRQRCEHGWWYQGATEARVWEIVHNEDAAAALEFLLSRCDYEYEYVEVQ